MRAIDAFVLGMLFLIALGGPARAEQLNFAECNSGGVCQTDASCSFGPSGSKSFATRVPDSACFANVHPWAQPPSLEIELTAASSCVISVERVGFPESRRSLRKDGATQRTSLILGLQAGQGPDIEVLVRALDCPLGGSLAFALHCTAIERESCNGLDDDCNGVVDDVKEVDFQTDSGNCGECGHRCAEGQICSAGYCICPSDYRPPCMICDSTGCRERCVDYAFDPDNCASCGRSCPAGYECSWGECKPTCIGYHLELCGGQCINTLRDAMNCGGCGLECAAGQVCIDGNCQCVSPLSACGSQCIDVRNDPQHCGGCGAVFRCNAGEKCVSGLCEPQCTGGDLKECGGFCIRLDQDPHNCGDCGVVCQAGELCRNGTCICAAQDAVYCRAGGRCVDPGSDVNNCGMCGVLCPIGWQCLDGLCVGPDNSLHCTSGAEACGAVCADLQYDPRNCGLCGNRCPEDFYCDRGQCKSEAPSCAYPLRLCGLACIAAESDAMNCGRCDNACSNQEVCTDGICVPSKGLPAADDSAPGTPSQACTGADRKVCGVACVTLSNDALHCGQCDRACLLSQICFAGNCVDPILDGVDSVESVVVPGAQNSLELVAVGDSWRELSGTEGTLRMEFGKVYGFVPSAPASHVAMLVKGKEVLTFRGSIVLNLAIPTFSISPPPGESQWTIALASDRVEEMIGRAARLPVVPDVIRFARNPFGDIVLYGNAETILFDLRDDPSQAHPQIEFEPEGEGKQSVIDVRIAGIGLRIKKMTLIFDPTDFSLEAEGKLSGPSLAPLITGSLQATDFTLRPFSDPPLSFGGTRLVLGKMNLGGFVIEGADDGSNPNRNIFIVFDVESGCFGIIPPSVEDCSKIANDVDGFIKTGDLEEFSRSLLIRTNPEGPWSFGAGFLCAYSKSSGQIEPLIVGGSVKARPGVPIAQTGLAFIGGSLVLSGFTSSFPAIDLRTEIEPIVSPLNEIVAFRNLGATIQPVHYMRASGDMELFGGQVASVEMSFEYAPSAWTGMTFDGIVTLPNADYTVIRAEAALRVGKDFGSVPPIGVFDGVIDGSVEIPKPDCEPWDLACQAIVLLVGEDNFPYRMTRLRQALETRISGGEYTVTISSSFFVIGQELALIVHADRLMKKDLVHAFELALPADDGGDSFKSVPLRSTMTVQEGSFTIDSDSYQSALLVLRNISAENAAPDMKGLRIVAPNGATYGLTETTPPASGQLAFRRGIDTSVVVIPSPMAGIWHLETTDQGAWEIRMFATSRLPDVTAKDIRCVDGGFMVDYTAPAVLAERVELCLFADREQGRLNGIPLGCAMIGGDGQSTGSSYIASAAELSGDYFPYIQIGNSYTNTGGSLVRRRLSPRQWKPAAADGRLHFAGQGSAPTLFTVRQDARTGKLLFQWTKVAGADGYVIYANAEGNIPSDLSPQMVVSSVSDPSYEITPESLAMPAVSDFMKEVKRSYGRRLVVNIRAYRYQNGAMRVSSPSEAAIVAMDEPLNRGNLPHFVSVPPLRDITSGTKVSLTLKAADLDLHSAAGELDFFLAQTGGAVRRGELASCISAAVSGAPFEFCIHPATKGADAPSEERWAEVVAELPATLASGPLSFWAVVKDGTGQLDQMKISLYVSNPADAQTCLACSSYQCVDGKLHCVNSCGETDEQIATNCECGCERGTCVACPGADGDDEGPVVRKKSGSSKGCSSATSPWTGLNAWTLLGLLLLIVGHRRRASTR